MLRSSQRRPGAGRNRPERTAAVKKTTVRALTGLTAALLALGLTPGAAQAARPQIDIGPVTVCKVITFFDVVIFEYDCYVEG
jgi:hypothetical protein